MVDALDCQSRESRFKSDLLRQFNSQVTQLVECRAVNTEVVGAGPTLGANLWKVKLKGLSLYLESRRWVSAHRFQLPSFPPFL